MTVDRAVAPAALGRAVLLGRGAATLTAAGTGLRLVPDPRPLLLAAAIAAATTVAGLAVLSRNPYVVHRRHRRAVLLARTRTAAVIHRTTPPAFRPISRHASDDANLRKGARVIACPTCDGCSRVGYIGGPWEHGSGPGCRVQGFRVTVRGQ